MTARQARSKRAPRSLPDFFRVYYFSCAQLLNGSESVPIVVLSAIKESGRDTPFSMKLVI